MAFYYVDTKIRLYDRKGHIRIWETKRWTDKLILNSSGRAVKVS
jgi:hypothetical protein